MESQVAVIYRKSDGKIVRVSSLHSSLVGQVTEEDLHRFLPDIDTSEFNMVFVKGRQYLEIEKYKVEIDVHGNFIDVVEKTDVLTSFNEDVQVNAELLDREADIVVSVLSVIDDPARLARYKELEQRGQNRPEVMNFFKERGVQ